MLIADDHRLFAEALEAILGRPTSRLEVVGHARDGAEAVKLATQLEPDVVLMDIAMPVLDGFEATRQSGRRRRAPRVLMLTGSNARSRRRSRARRRRGRLRDEGPIAAELVEAIFDAA